MLLLELQQDTKKQIQEIYKHISLHSLQQLNPKVEVNDSIVPGLADRLLSAYYNGNHIRCNELIKLCENIDRAKQVVQVCNSVSVPQAAPVKVPQANVSYSRRAKYGQRKRKDRGIIPDISSKHSTEIGGACDKIHNVGGKKRGTGEKNEE